MQLTEEKPREGCRELSGALSAMGDKWTVMLVAALVAKPRRFNEIKRSVAGISSQMLALTLKGLERDGLVTRTVRPAAPPQVQYALSDLGTSFAHLIQHVGGWAQAHSPQITEHRRRFDARIRATEAAQRGSFALSRHPADPNDGGLPRA